MTRTILMTPAELLYHHDQGRLWPAAPSAHAAFDLPAAYRQALAVRQLRLDRGERPCGFKIGFTNHGIWARYGVYAPIWGTVYDSTLHVCEGQATLDLAGICQPRLEPEVVFGMRATPEPDASLDALFAAIDWVAPGFEIVQCHLPDWTFQAPDTVADGGLHARLLVGTRLPVASLARDAAGLDALLAAGRVTLWQHDRLVETGFGANVLDSPLRALHHFLGELRHCVDAPALRAGDVVTTGTWTDAWPVSSGQSWRAQFTAPLPTLTVDFTHRPA